MWKTITITPYPVYNIGIAILNLLYLQLIAIKCTFFFGTRVVYVYVWIL